MSALHRYIAKDGFRLRGAEMSRIDGFSDVVFGFALTLLVVSLEVPHTYDELRAVLLGFIPFAICFTFLILVWWAHFRFFRRYGLHDTGTMLINSLLLFTLLFYVYPLKFLFSLATGNAHVHVFSEPHQLRHLMVVYGLGYAAVYACFVALYWNAWRQRHALHLNALEVTLTHTYLWANVGRVGAGLLCCLVACLLPPGQAQNAGWVFFSIALYETVHGRISARKTRRARARCTPAELTAPVHHD